MSDQAKQIAAQKEAARVLDALSDGEKAALQAAVMGGNAFLSLGSRKAGAK